MAVVGSAYVRLLPVAAGFADAAKAELQPELDAIAAQTAEATDKAGVGAGESLAGGLAAGAKSGEADVEEAAAGLAGAGGRGLGQVEEEADKAGKAAASKLGNGLSGIGGVVTNALGAVGISMGKTGDKATEMGSKIAGGSAKASGALGSIAAVGGVALGAVVIGSVVAGAAAVKLGIDFQASTTHLAASAGISVAAANRIGQAFLDTAGTSIYTGKQMVDALTPVSGILKTLNGSALSASQSVGFMKTAGDLAEASNTSLGTATAVLARTMQAYGAKVSEANHYTDVIFNTSRITGQTIDQLGASFQKLHSTLGDVTPPIGQLGGLLVDLTEHGETGRKALSAINTSLNGLLAPTTAVANVQKLLGLSVFDAQGKFVGFGSIIDQLQPKLAGMSQQQQLATLKAAGFGTANKALLTTILAGSAAYEKATADAGKVGGAQAAAAKQAQTLGHEWDTIKASAIDLGTKLGVVLLPYVQRFFAYLVDGAKYLLQHKTLLEALAIAIGVTLVAAIGVFLGVAIAAASATTVALAGLPIIIGAITVAAVLLVTHWKQVWTDVKNWFDDAVNFIRNKLGFWGNLALLFIAPWLLIAVHWQAIWAVVSSVLSTTAGVVRGIVGGIASVVTGTFAAIASAVRPYMSALRQIVGGEFQIIAALVVGAFNLIKVAVGTAWSIIVTIFQTVVGIITGIVKVFAALFTGNWTALWNAITGIFTTILGGLAGIASSIFNGLVGFFTAICGVIVGVFSGAVSVIKGTLSAAWTAVSGALTAAWGGIVSFFTTVPGAIVGALGSGLSVLLQWGKDLITGIANGITGAAGTISHALVAAVKAAVGDVKNAVNSIPVIGGALSAIGLATGGYVTKPTLALVGEAGPEFVIPEAQARSAFGAGVAPLPANIGAPIASAAAGPGNGAALAAGAAGLSVYTNNVDALSTATGLAVPYVEALASSLGIKLTKALDPQQIVKFTQTVKDQGGTADVAGKLWEASAAKIKASIDKAEASAVTSMPGVSKAVQNMVATTQPALVTLVGNLNKTGDKVGGTYVSSFLAKLTPAQLASKQMHNAVLSPLLPLEQELRIVGDKAGANHVAAFIGHVPAAQAAAYSMHGAILGPANAIVADMHTTGDNAGMNLVQSFLNHHPGALAAANEMHGAVSKTLAPLEADLLAVGDTSGAAFVAGIMKHDAAATTAGAFYHDALKKPLDPLELELGAKGDSSANALIQEFIKHNPEAATAAGLMHDAVNGKLGALANDLALAGDSAGTSLVNALINQQGAAGVGGAALGKAVTDGMANGITVGQGVVVNSVSGLVTSVITAGRNGLVARSPSVVFTNLGMTIPQGLAVGVTGQTHVATAATTALAKGMVEAANGVFATTSITSGLTNALNARANVTVTGGVAGQSSPATAPRGPSTVSQQQLEVMRLVLAALMRLVDVESAPSTLTLMGQLPGSNAVQEIATGIAR